jgi:hydrogenase expression/formation protein HypE
MGEGIMIRGVLFDFDGTLTSPGALDFPAIKRKMGCPVEQPILEFLQTVSPRRRPRLMKTLEEFEDRAAKASRPNAGAEKTIAELKAKGILMGILTRNSLSSVKKALQKFNGVTAHDFVVIVTRDESLPKPYPDGVHKAAEKMGISAKELLVVGDFRFDIIAGSTAGAKTALLADGQHFVMTPEDPEPDYTVYRLEEILDLLEPHQTPFNPPERAVPGREK